MKRNIFKIFAALTFVFVVQSCKKDDSVNIDLTKYIDSPYSDSDLDKWLRANFLDTYNIDVIYRYSDFYKDYDKVVSPVDLTKVRPQMQMVLEGFIAPYKKIAGTTFVKQKLPKEWVLYGSGAYNTDGSMILATAGAGRRVTIYTLNNFDINDPNLVIPKLKTIHHEFTHILNQLVSMPTDFQTITKASYNATWTTVLDATARDLGYVTPYATSQPGEDFAETTSTLLVFGQAWFDARANASTAAGKLALKAKEASVVQYFTVSLGIDFRALQREVQQVVRQTYKYPAASFQYWVGQNLFKTMTTNLEDPIYTNNAISADYTTAYNNFKATVLAANTTSKFHMDNVQLRFESATALTVRVAYTPTAGTTAGTQSNADYTFTYTINSVTGAVVFTKVAQAGTTGTYANAALFTAGFTSSLQAYLTGKTFIADWMPSTIDNANYNSFGGFYVSGTPTNNFYGSLGQTL